MIVGTELWGLAPLAWALLGLIAVRRLARERRPRGPAIEVRPRDAVRRAA